MIATELWAYGGTNICTASTTALGMVDSNSLLCDCVYIFKKETMEVTFKSNG